MNGDETLAEVLAAHALDHRPDDGYACICGVELPLVGPRIPFSDHQADAVLAHLDLAARDRVVAATAAETARAEALEEARLAIASSVPLNYELRHDGSEDPLAAAYVEGVRDAHNILRDLAAAHPDEESQP